VRKNKKIAKLSSGLLAFAECAALLFLCVIDVVVIAVIIAAIFAAICILAYWLLKLVI